MKQIGIISDTHGILDNQALAALNGAHLIFHAGDVGGPAILDALMRLAPVVAVRGNTDGGGWAKRLPVSDLTAVDGYYFYLLHDSLRLDIDPGVADVQAIISGHTHRPLIQWSNGLLRFNPGSASQARYGGPRSVGRIRVSAAGLEPEIIILDD